MRAILPAGLLAVAVATVAASPRQAVFDPFLTADVPSALEPDFLEGGNEFYTVRMLPEVGAGLSAARTGPDHPVTMSVLSPSSVARPGIVEHAWGNFAAVRSYTSGRDLLVGQFLGPDPSGGDFPCESTDRLAPGEVVPVEERGRVVGFLYRQAIDDGADHLAIEREVRAVGGSFASASVVLTLRVRNLGSGEAVVGVRFTTATTIGLLRQVGDGLLPATSAAYLGLRPPGPPTEPPWTLEAEWERPDKRTWEQHRYPDPSVSPWLYFNGGSLRGTTTMQPPATPPDLFQYVPRNRPDLRDLRDTCFRADIADPPVAIGSSSSGLIALWGPTEEEAIRLAPGEQVAITTHRFAFVEWPVTCVAAGPVVVECEGPLTSARVDGGDSEVVDGTPLAFAWSAAGPGVTFSDPRAVDPLATLPGVGEWPLDLLVEVGPYFDECTTAVQVVDTTPPEIDAPASVVVRTSEMAAPSCPAPVALVASAFDLCAGDDVLVTNDATAGGADASGVYPVGDRIVTFTATDPSGNVGERRVLVRVIDDTPPGFELLGADPALLWPPNHRLVEVAVRAVVTDDCDEEPELRLVEVRSSEPADDRGDGRTEPDIVGAALGTADLSVQLRAERDGRGVGRRYTLVYEAEDESRNIARAEVDVVVPHDRRGGPP